MSRKAAAYTINDVLKRAGIYSPGVNNHYVGVLYRAGFKPAREVMANGRVVLRTWPKETVEFLKNRRAEREAAEQSVTEAEAHAAVPVTPEADTTPPIKAEPLRGADLTRIEAKLDALLEAVAALRADRDEDADLLAEIEQNLGEVSGELSEGSAVLNKLVEDFASIMDALTEPADEQEG